MKTYQREECPVPGYEVTEYLGRGGFGEVWKASGPGGIQVALKIIHDLDRKKGGKELRALRMLKNIRHPNLVPLLGFWLKSDDGELVNDDVPTATAAPGLADHGALRGTLAPEIHSTSGVALASEAAELIVAMGLCDKSLFDRLEECQAEGSSGVPQDELLTYMEDAARAIDLLNTKHDIQHCDIKPQNILLLSGAAQVADFGLAKMIGHVRESSMVAGTIAYGAPEMLLGKGPSPTTDQYSLAISYFELRTGSLPFGSERISDVLHAKQHGRMELSLLPAAEQEVIGTAAALDPEQRYPSCAAMVKALRVTRSTEIDEARCVARPRSDLASVLLETPRQRTGTTTPEWKKQDQDNANPRPRFSARFALGAVGLALLSCIAIGLAVYCGRTTERQAEDSLSVTSSSEDAAAPPRETAPALQQQGINQSVAQQQPAQLTSQELNHQEATQLQSASPSSSSRSAESAPGQAEQTQLQVGRAAQPVATPVASDLAAEIADAAKATADNTRNIAEAARRTAENTSQLTETTKQIAQSLDVIRDEFAKAANRGGVIDAPQTAGDFYHNARLYEQRGDYRNARASYTRLLSFQLNAVDPHLRYQRLLRAAEGQLAAWQTYLELVTPQSDLATRFAVLLLEPDDTRAAKLLQFTIEHPDFAPAFYELSREYSAERLGAQGLADMAFEKNQLEYFDWLVQQGWLMRYFLDQTEAVKMVDEARTRLAALRKIDSAVFDRPVRVSFSMSNTSWSVHLAIAESARTIQYRLEGAEPEDTGLLNFVDQRTGRPAPKPSFELPLTTTRTKFYVTYSDIRGNEQGPFEFEFDPEVERVRNGKDILESFPNSWVVFGESHGRLLAYFTHLVGYRYAIREGHYSIDSEKLDQVFPLPAEHPGKLPGSTQPGDTIYITVPHSITFVAVRVTYRDGTQSKVHRFERR